MQYQSLQSSWEIVLENGKVDFKETKNQGGTETGATSYAIFLV